MEELTQTEKGARLMRGLKRFLADSDKDRAMSDRELVAAVIEKVWAKQNLGSEEDWLIDQLVTRYEKLVGIERDEEGRVIPEKS